MLARLVLNSWPGDPSASASQNAEITDVSHCTRPRLAFLTPVYILVICLSYGLLFCWFLITLQIHITFYPGVEKDLTFNNVSLEPFQMSERFHPNSNDLLFYVSSIISSELLSHYHFLLIWPMLLLLFKLCFWVTKHQPLDYPTWFQLLPWLVPKLFLKLTNGT